MTPISLQAATCEVTWLYRCGRHRRWRYACSKFHSDLGLGWNKLRSQVTTEPWGLPRRSRGAIWTSSYSLWCARWASKGDEQPPSNYLSRALVVVQQLLWNVSAVGRQPWQDGLMQPLIHLSRVSHFLRRTAEFRRESFAY